MIEMLKDLAADLIAELIALVDALQAGAFEEWYTKRRFGTAFLLVGSTVTSLAFSLIFATSERLRRHGSPLAFGFFLFFYSSMTLFPRNLPPEPFLRHPIWNFVSGWWLMVAIPAIGLLFLAFVANLLEIWQIDME
ncbi:MAG: hypothetical protein ABL957_01515 [Parvularculaceae bacterium]